MTTPTITRSLLAALAGLGLAACGGPRSVEPSRDYERRDVDPQPRQEEGADDDEWTEEGWADDEWDEEEPWDDDDNWDDPYGAEGALSVVGGGFIGQVGPYLFSDESARIHGYHYSDEYSDTSYSSLDTRTDVEDGKAVMVALFIEGGLDHPALQEGVTFSVEDQPEWDAESPLFISALGCAGEEDMWEEYDAPADEVEVTVTPDEEDPDVVDVDYVARWTSYEGDDVLEVKGFTTVQLP